MDFEEIRFKLFLQICDKQDLDLKGEDIKSYASNFRSAFMRAHNIAWFYVNMEYNVDGNQKTTEDLDYGEND